VASGVLSRSSSRWLRDVLCFSASRLTLVDGIAINRRIVVGSDTP
jgi:hypothetical protein